MIGFDSTLALIFVACGIYGIFHANKVMRETAEGKRKGYKPMSSKYSYSIFFWLS